MKMERRENRRRKRIQMHPSEHCLDSCSFLKWKERCVLYVINTSVVILNLGVWKWSIPFHKIVYNYRWKKFKTLLFILWQNLKKTNPGISFTDVGRVLGEKWKKMSGMAHWQLFHFMQFHFHLVSFVITG
jgi:hypothetical protein